MDHLLSEDTDEYRHIMSKFENVINEYPNKLRLYSKMKKLEDLLLDENPYILANFYFKLYKKHKLYDDKALFVISTIVDFFKLSDLDEDYLCITLVNIAKTYSKTIQNLEEFCNVWSETYNLEYLLREEKIFEIAVKKLINSGTVITFGSKYIPEEYMFEQDELLNSIKDKVKCNENEKAVILLKFYRKKYDRDNHEEIKFSKIKKYCNDELKKMFSEESDEN